MIDAIQSIVILFVAYAVASAYVLAIPGWLIWKGHRGTWLGMLIGFFGLSVLGRMVFQPDFSVSLMGMCSGCMVYDIGAMIIGGILGSFIIWNPKNKVAVLHEKVLDSGTFALYVGGLRGKMVSLREYMSICVHSNGIDHEVEVTYQTDKKFALAMVRHHDEIWQYLSQAIINVLEHTPSRYSPECIAKAVRTLVENDEDVNLHGIPFRIIGYCHNDSYCDMRENFTSPIP